MVVLMEALLDFLQVAWDAIHYRNWQWGIGDIVVKGLGGRSFPLAFPPSLVKSLGV